MLVALNGLVASLVGAIIAFWAQAANWRRARRAQSADDESRAIERLLVKALSMDLRAHQLALAAKSRGSLDGTILALLGSEGPINPHATIQAMTQDAEDLHAAATHLWLTSDPRTVELAREVSDAAAGVIEAHNAGRRPRMIGWLLDLVLGPPLGDRQRIESARAVLAAKRGQLVQHTRARFNLPELSPPSSEAD